MLRDIYRYLCPVHAEVSLVIHQRLSGLLPLTSPKLGEIKKQAEGHQRPQPPNGWQTERSILVFGRHKHYRNPVVELLVTERTKSDGLKAPFHRLEPLKLLAVAAGVDEAKFYAAIARLQQVESGDRTDSDLTALRTVIKSGSEYPCYYHNEQL